MYEIVCSAHFSRLSFAPFDIGNDWRYWWSRAAVYDDRSVRSHVRRTRDLLSMENMHASLSTTFATEYEAKQDASGGSFENFQILLCGP